MPASSALLRIADQGIGIPDEIRDKIFDLYFTTKTGGSGIGLAMTYRILQLHHGSVEVQSRQKSRHGISAANSASRRRQGTPESSAGGVDNDKGDGEMKSPARCAAWLLPFLLTGCIHTPLHKNASMRRYHGAADPP